MTMDVAKTSVGQTLQKKQTANIANKKLSFGNNENKEGGIKVKDMALMTLPGAGAAIGTFVKQEPKYDNSMLEHVIENPEKFQVKDALKDVIDKEFKHEAGDIKLEEKGAKNALNKATTTAKEANIDILERTKLVQTADEVLGGSVLDEVAKKSVTNGVKSDNLTKVFGQLLETIVNEKDDKFGKEILDADKDSDLRKVFDVTGEGDNRKIKVKEEALKLVGTDGKELSKEDAGKLTKKADDAMSVFKKVATEISDKLPKVPKLKNIMIGTGAGTALALGLYAATSGGDKKAPAQKLDQKSH